MLRCDAEMDDEMRFAGYYDVAHPDPDEEPPAYVTAKIVKRVELPDVAGMADVAGIADSGAAYVLGLYDGHQAAMLAHKPDLRPLGDVVAELAAQVAELRQEMELLKQQMAAEAAQGGGA